NKSPGPGGYTFEFFRRHWRFIGSDFCSAVECFFESWSFPKGSNSSFIALIPKVTDAKFVTDFRPISLIGCVYKVVTKILANRLATVISDLVSDIQSSFVANKKFLDGPFILNELLAWCKRKKKKAMIFKVDFAKAYDSVHWDYLLDVLQAFGFGPNWCKWTRGTFSFAMALILVNGSPTSEFPFLATSDGLFKGIHIQGSMAISHLFYADDAVFIREWSDSNPDNIVKILKCFFLTLTLLKLVLGASPLYNMSIYKVPKGVLKEMEAIRYGSLWYRVIEALYDASFELHPVNQSSIWCSNLREMQVLISKGFDFVSRCKKRVGDGHNTRFWYDSWVFDQPLRVRFPRLFALEMDKETMVASKLGSSSVDASFRRSVHRGICDLNGDGVFRVKEVRTILDNIFLPSAADATRWVKYIPIKINVFAWHARLNRLPTRSNLVRRGVVLDSSLCPLCGLVLEDIHHVLFRIKLILEGVFYLACWHLWVYRNQSIFAVIPPRRSVIFDDIVSRSFTWCTSRYTQNLIDDSMLPDSSTPIRWCRFIPKKVNILIWRILRDRVPAK
nr:RNA-directed DNA polymerase, eukaryota, reverse transcriptase zinc-binding domain protein [Tanacetum cinerariifolium]